MTVEVSQTHEFDSLLNDIRARFNLPAVGLGILYGTGHAFIGITGVRRAGRDSEVTLADKWHQGSLTKSMTALIAGTLVQEGVLDWSTSPASIFSDAQEISPGWHTVTLDHLLTHTSGVAADTLLDKRGEWHPVMDKQAPVRQVRAEFANMMLRQPIESPPGENFVYGNGSYILAGAMIERLTGVDWEELVRKRIFEPFGMESAGFGAPARVDKQNQPFGHVLEEGIMKPVEPGPGDDNVSALGPAGTVHCSLPDMMRYLAFHLAGARGERGIAERLGRSTPGSVRSQAGTVHDTERFSAGNLDPDTLHHIYADLDPNKRPLGWMMVPRDWAYGPTLHHTGSNGMWFTNVWLAPFRNRVIMAVTNYGGPGAFEAMDSMISEALHRNYLKQYTAM